MGWRIAAGWVAWGLVSAPAGAADCVAPVTGEQLDEALGRAEAAWSQSDNSGFDAALQEIDVFDLPCLAEPVAPAIVARLHRVRGLASFADRSRENAFSAMRAARVLAPEFKFDTSLLPTGHELATAYEAAPTTPASPGRKLAAPAHPLYFDGTATRWRPTDRPTLAQLTDARGAVTQSSYLWPSDPMPDYARRPKTQVALAVTAGVAGALFASLFGGSFAARDAYDATDPGDTDRLDSLRSTTNGLAGSGIAFGVVGLGAGIASIAVGSR